MVRTSNFIRNNVERFSGFEAQYERFRPTPPSVVVDVLTAYCGKKPSLVLDVGSGTGLSSFVWHGHADRVIGMEPNVGMRRQAQAKLNALADSSISFGDNYSYQLEIESETVDIITCSQSFHWMEPRSTLTEFARVLKPKGVFAAYDCDWPPTIDIGLETAYMRLFNRIEEIAATLRDPSAAHKFEKENHLQNLRQSRLFRFVKEVVFHHQELLDAERYFGLALTQGGLQAVMRARPMELQAEINAFQQQVTDFFQNRTHPVWFSYRMRLGVK